MAHLTVLGSISEFERLAKKKNKSNTPVGTDVGIRFGMLGTIRR